MTWLEQNWGNLASVIGLAVTVVNAFQIRALKRRLEQRYTLMGRVPQINAQLQQHCDTLALALANFEQSKHDARLELQRAAVTLESLQSNLPPNAARTKIEAALQQIKSYGAGSENELRAVYERLTVVTDTVDYRIEDDKWKNQ